MRSLPTSPIRLLAAVLAPAYPPGHRGILYEIPLLPLSDPVIHPTPLADLAAAPVTVASTLYVPPLDSPAPIDPEMLDRLGLSRRQ